MPAPKFSRAEAVWNLLAIRDEGKWKNWPEAVKAIVSLVSRGTARFLLGIFRMAVASTKFDHDDTMQSIMTPNQRFVARSAQRKGC